jgi:transposase
MFVKSITKNNITRLYYYESYYKDGKVKQRMVEPIGRLDVLEKTYDDPVAHFKEKAKELSVEKKENSIISISIDKDSALTLGEDDLKNAGYGVIKNLYFELELDRFWRWKTQGRTFKYNDELIFRLLVISRVLFPASKKETYERRGIYFEKFEGFSLDDVYHMLDLIDEHQEALQKWIYQRSDKIVKRDLTVSYFDCTNYYFDIGRPDVDILDDDGNPVDKDGNSVEAKYRKRGPEKNHRPDPIVEMGLLTDRNGIPLAYDLFPGNESEKVHMRPIIKRIKDEYTDCRIIFVADRGLNTSDNIYFINGNNKGENNQRDGYVYGQSVRGADEEFKKWVLSTSEYIKDKVLDEEDNEIIFLHKSRIYPKTLKVNVTVPGSKKKKKKSVSVDQKQMVYYSEKYAIKQRRDRNIMVERAKDLIMNTKKYDKVTSAGSASYVKNISFDKTTGEIIEDKTLLLDTDKIAEEEKYDGYYSIVTSELNMSDFEIRDIYRGLARIEETFKISKSDFLSRPMFVRTNEHIDAHFATCFTALVLIRLLQVKLDCKFSITNTLNSLRKYNCVNIGSNIWQFLYYDEILEACANVFNMELNNKYRTQLQIKHMLRY